jgi:iron-sulfur cluster repair protein YtfE (RIC family)
MMHSSPKPLKVALDLAKRLHQELSKHMTPEQRRDFVRVQRLIDEADRNHVIEVTRLMHRSQKSPQVAAATEQPHKRRFLWM